jgi:branched-chain amino acid transport system substrate-binding protein
MRRLPTLLLSFASAGLAAALALALALSPLAGCKKDGSANEIRIGHYASMNGDTATFGQSADKGIRLAMEEINSAGGVLGKQINVITEDDRSVTSEARTTAQKLITRDQVVALLGEVSSSRSIAAAPVAQQAKIPMLSPGSTNPKVTEVGDFIFRNCFIDPFQGEAMARFAMETLGKKRFAILYANNSDYSVGLRDYITQAVQAGGGQVVAQESYAEKQDKDFTGLLTKIKAANPEAIFVPGYYTEAGLIADQARKLGLNVPLIGGDGWDSDVLVKAGGDAIEGNYFTNHYSPDEQRPEVQAFVQAYKKKYNGEVPDAMAVLGYDAMKMMADAIKRAGGTDGQKIRDALAATKDFPGAGGKITINEKRNADKPIVVVQVKDKQFKYVTSIEPKK